ncbi:MAG: DinB family protein, partial [Runella sp.]
AFRLPTFVLGWVFGKANHPSKSYDELVAKYKARLAAATVQPPRQFQPKTQPFENRAKLAKDLQRNVEKLSQLLQTKPETLLDSYVLPHPLLGKLTLREMLYFTIYHVQHHQTLIQKNLSIK